MCLVINREATEKLKNSGQTEIKVYKVLRKKGTDLVSPFKEMVYKPGEIVATGVPHPDDELHGIIKVGIHVFLEKSEADFFISACYDSIIVECTANISDLIACGTFNHFGIFNSAVFKKIIFNSAVFKKITVSEENLNRVHFIDLHTSPYQTLKNSIAKRGQLDPIIVEKIKNKYRLLDGFRRLNILTELEIPNVKCKVVEAGKELYPEILEIPIELIVTEEDR